jgi:hypothetical protein
MTQALYAHRNNKRKKKTCPELPTFCHNLQMVLDFHNLHKEERLDPRDTLNQGQSLLPICRVRKGCMTAAQVQRWGLNSPWHSTKQGGLPGGGDYGPHSL